MAELAPYISDPFPKAHLLNIPVPISDVFDVFKADVLHQTEPEKTNQPDHENNIYDLKNYNN